MMRTYCQSKKKSVVVIHYLVIFLKNSLTVDIILSIKRLYKN